MTMAGSFNAFIRRLRDNCAGSMVVETALIVPALAGMAIAGVEISTMVVRQHELQAAASNAAEIIIAAQPDDAAQEAQMVDEVGTWLASATGLTKTTTIDGANQVRVVRVIRCGNSNTFKSAGTGCESGQNKAIYVQIQMVENYDPFWKAVGIGEDMTFKVQRSIRIG